MITSNQKLLTSRYISFWNPDCLIKETVHLYVNFWPTGILRRLYSCLFIGSSLISHDYILHYTNHLRCVRISTIFFIPRKTHWGHVRQQRECIDTETSSKLHSALCIISPCHGFVSPVYWHHTVSNYRLYCTVKLRHTAGGWRFRSVFSVTYEYLGLHLASVSHSEVMPRLITQTIRWRERIISTSLILKAVGPTHILCI